MIQNHIQPSRPLTTEELRRLLQAASASSPTTRAFLMLLMATAQRSGEVVEMDWDEIDLTERTWIRPPSGKTKKKHPVLPLTGFCIRLLTSLPDNAEPRIGPVFGSEGHRKSVARRARFEVAQNLRLDADEATPPVTLRFRRTFAHFSLDFGASIETGMNILQHRYDDFDRHCVPTPQMHETAMRAVLQAWSDHLEGLLPSPTVMDSADE